MCMPQFTGRDASRFAAYGVPALVGIVVLLAGIALIPPLVKLGMTVDGTNEGWNALHSIHAFSGALYPPRNEFVVNNYPPLWYYLTGGLALVFGDPVFPGRIISILAFAATAMAIFSAIRRLGGSAGAGSIAGLTFVATMTILYRWWIGLAEPQMLAQALITGATALLLGARSPRIAALAAFLMVLGGLTKHIAVALPLASAVWLAIYRRNLLVPWLATGVITGSVALLALTIGYGEAFIDNMAIPRRFSLNSLGSNLGWGITKSIVPLLGFSLLAVGVERARDDAMAFAGLAIAAALLVILVFGSAWGVGENVTIDLVIACSLACGLLWDRVKWLRRVPANVARMVLIGALVVRLLLGMHDPISTIAGFRIVAAATTALESRLREVADPVACELLLVCIWAGHRNPSSVTNVADINAMYARLADGEFGAVVMAPDFEAEQDDAKRPRGIAAAMRRGYYPPIHFGFAGNLFLPRRSSSSTR